MKSALRYSLFLIFGALAVLPAAAGQLYKWTDASGRVQYSDTPPPNVKTEVLKNSNIGTSSAPPSSVADQEQAFQKRRAQAEENNQKLAQQESEKKQLAENCSRTRQALASLDGGSRTYDLDEKGERVYFDASRTAAEKTRLRKLLDENCK